MEQKKCKYGCTCMIVENKTFDEERALYASSGLLVKNCRFDGPADGESALKESMEVTAEGCFFNLRYPFWHDHYIAIHNSDMTELCRAALWYSDHVEITGTKLHGIKALRECQDITMRGCDIISPEFGWSVSNVTMEDSTAQSEYFMMRSENLKLSDVRFSGKYSFQYTKNVEITNSVLNTKDAFWHSQNVVVRDSEVNGEYLGWYSDHLTFINCTITGTQPLCYCTNLKLINCKMIGTDLAFERSEVEAVITSPIDSIKNPHRGSITAPAAGEIILDDEEAKRGKCQIKIGGEAESA